MVNRQRAIQIKFYVDSDEQVIIQKKAKESKLKMSSYIRTMAIEGYILKQDLVSIRSLAFELNKIGVNINQIAKKANEIGEVHRADVKDIKRKMDDIWQLVRSTL